MSSFLRSKGKSSQKLFTLKRARMDFSERFDFLNLSRIGFKRPSVGKELAGAQTAFSLFPMAIGMSGLLEATGQNQKQAHLYQSMANYRC